MKSKAWLWYASTTMLTWGVWGALIEIPEKEGFPATLGYIGWAISMLLGAVLLLKKIEWKLDKEPFTIFLVALSGIFGCGSYLLLLHTLTFGPAYLVFPIIAVSPVITIILSHVFLKERASKLNWIGIVFATIAIVMLSYQPDTGETVVKGYTWFIYSIIIMFAWGFQAYLLKLTNQSFKPESVVFYSIIPLIVIIPIAYFMTDLTQPINWGIEGFYAAIAIQLLNSGGYFTFVYAFKYGKAIIVSPMVNAMAPVITVILSLMIYQVIPNFIIIIGIVLAIISAFFMSFEAEE